MKHKPVKGFAEVDESICPKQLSYESKESVVSQLIIQAKPTQSEAESQDFGLAESDGVSKCLPVFNNFQIFGRHFTLM